MRLEALFESAWLLYLRRRYSIRPVVVEFPHGVGVGLEPGFVGLWVLASDSLLASPVVLGTRAGFSILEPPRLIELSGISLGPEPSLSDTMEGWQILSGVTRIGERHRLPLQRDLAAS